MYSRVEKRLGTKAWNISLKMATDEIPVVDFIPLSLENKDPFSKISKDIEELADQVYQAFSTIGFVYLKNHGIPQEVVSEFSFLRGCEIDVVTNQTLPHEKKFTSLRYFTTWTNCVKGKYVISPISAYEIEVDYF